MLAAKLLHATPCDHHATLEFLVQILLSPPPITNSYIFYENVTFFGIKNIGTSLLVSFGGDSKSRRSLQSGVYARGSKRPHQSALECVTVVDSTAHSKSPRSASMWRKTLPCTEEEEENWVGPDSTQVPINVQLFRSLFLVLHRQIHSFVGDVGRFAVSDVGRPCGTFF